MPVSAEHRCHNELLVLEPQVSSACSCECLIGNPLPCLYLCGMFAGHQLHIKKGSLYFGAWDCIGRTKMPSMLDHIFSSAFALVVSILVLLEYM